MSGAAARTSDLGKKEDKKIRTKAKKGLLKIKKQRVEGKR